MKLHHTGDGDSAHRYLYRRDVITVEEKLDIASNENPTTPAIFT